MKQNTIFLLKKIKETLKKNKKNKNIKVNINNEDPNKVWAFCSGHNSNDFRGNPKYLFIYINNYRKDIDAYWLCNDINLINQIKSMGYKAYKIGSSEAEILAAKTGVLVAEQVKIEIPSGLEKVKYLNLWHGVGGIKNVERSIDDGILLEQIAKKYIDKNEFYRENELYLAPSKLIEDIATKQLGLSERQIIRAGYPRNIFQKEYERISTFNFDIVLNKLPKDTKIIAYTPTFRNFKSSEVFLQAMPDLEKLIEICKKKHLLFIFKMHPYLEKESSFIIAKEKYKDCKWLYFWDNMYDFYEIMDKIDLCIYDFSSIFTDFVACGTKNFIRYNFDFESEDLKFPFEYDKMTLGTKCKTFEDLLTELDNFQNRDYSRELNNTNKLFWEYQNNNDMDKIIDETIKFIPLTLDLPILYSFDIFDTLITRRGVEPISIFYYVKEKMNNKNYKFPKYLQENFPQIRKNAESNIREYYNRTIIERNDKRCEIKLDEIYDRIKIMYNLSDDAAEFLKKLEIEGELKNVLPIKENINILKELNEKGNKIILISDMYLPENVIKQMLKKADPILEKFDLYLSSTLGYQKSRKTLYLEVYKKYGIHYNFKKWIHTGDNDHSDIKMARELNIEPIKVEKLEFNEYENDLVKSINTYDAYLIAGAMARFRKQNKKYKEEFVYNYISLLFVPYIDWAIHDAINNKYEIVYFISRDGHNLKRIADKIIEQENLDIKTKYIYASRKTWRVPSFIDSIDVDFWGHGHGNFADVSNYKKLLKALMMDEQEFLIIFPELEYLKSKKEILPEEMKDLVKVFETSEKYNDYLLNKAKELRKSSCGYLKQEIDNSKKFAIIEYWGRGYTQENFTRLWQHITGKEEQIIFYYSRSTLPTIGNNIRKNFIVNSSAQQFIEAIFGCINYKSIEKYEYKNNKWKPIINKNNCDLELFNALETQLINFTENYVNIDFLDRDSIGRSLIDFAINYYNINPNWTGFVNVLGKLKDSVQLYGEIEEFAPKLTRNNIDNILNNKVKINNLTKNITISINRSDEEIQKTILDIYQTNFENKIILNKKLTKKELENDKINKEKLKCIKNKAKLLSKYYNLNIEKTEVKNKILLLTSNAYFNELEYKSLLNELAKQKEYIVVKRALKYHKINYKKLAKEIAEAKYIILKKPLNLLHDLSIRKESQLIILGDNVINYFSKGLLKKDKIISKSDLSKYEYYLEPDIMQIPNIELIKYYKKIYNIKDKTKFLETGNVFTDCYFDNEQKKYLRNKLNAFFPAAKNKKVISYIPYARYANKKAKYLNYLNIKMLEKYLKNEYVIILHQNPIKNYVNNLNIKGFAKDLTRIFNAREQMMIADIIVGDYRDTLFESPLLEVPIFITSWDKAIINSQNKNMFNFNEMKYGIEVTNTYDLIEKIRDIKNYNYNISNEFKQKYLTKCVGKSAKNIIEYLTEENKKEKNNEHK